MTSIKYSPRRPARAAPLLLCLLLASSPLAAQLLGGSQQREPIARVLAVSGVVQSLSPAGEVRPLKRGDWLYSGDHIATGSGSYAQLRFQDGGRIAFPADTEFSFDAVYFDAANSTENSALMTLLRGGFHTLSGSTDADEYEIRTEFASIGIRGTNHGAVIDPASGSLLTAVYDGGTTVFNAQGEIDLGSRGDYDFSQTFPGSAPVGLLTPPIELRAIAQINISAGSAPAGATFGGSLFAPSDGEEALALALTSPQPSVPADAADSGGLAQGRPALLLAELTGDDTEAQINPAQNLRRVADIAADPDAEEDEDERGNGNNGRGNGGRSAALLSVSEDPSGLPSAPAEAFAIRPLDDGRLGIVLAGEGKAAAGTPQRPAAGLDVSWGYWNDAEPILSAGNSSGALTPWNELAYWASVLPADMDALRALAGQWRFATNGDGTQFLGGSEAGALSSLDLRFDLNLDSGTISRGSFRGVVGEGLQTWTLDFEGQVEGAQANLQGLQGSLRSAAGSSAVHGDIQGVFTGSPEHSGFAAGFSLESAQGSQLQGLGLLHGIPR